MDSKSSTPSLARVGPDQGARTMSSAEIADLVEKRHDNVKRTIETLAARGVIASPQTEEKPTTGGRPGVEYRIGKRDSFVVVAQLSPEFTARLVDRWAELEAGAAPAPLDLTDPAALRTLLLGYTEKVLALQNENAAMAPKALFHDAVADASNAQTIQEVGKLFGMSQNRMFAKLREMGMLLRNNLPAQAHLDAGRFRVVERTYENPSGQQHTYTRTLITGVGLQYLQKRLAKTQEVSHV